MRVLLLISLLIAITGWAGIRLESKMFGISKAEANSNEGLYLPKLAALNFLSFGYKNVLADLIWFKTISYFGKHYQSDRDFTYLSHMCDLTLALDPKMRHAYEFCGTMLAWEVSTFAESIKIWSRAIEVFPLDWRYPYFRGFTYMYFLKDQERARNDFMLAAKIPGADPIVARLAAKKFLDMNDPVAAIGFLSDILKRTNDPAQRAALIRRIQEAQVELRKRDLAAQENSRRTDEF